MWCHKHTPTNITDALVVDDFIIGSVLCPVRVFSLSSRVWSKPTNTESSIGPYSVQTVVHFSEEWHEDCAFRVFDGTIQQSNKANDVTLSLIRFTGGSLLTRTYMESVFTAIVQNEGRSGKIEASDVLWVDLIERCISYGTDSLEAISVVTHQVHLYKWPVSIIALDFVLRYVAIDVLCIRRMHTQYR
jgi:hypothetical protein